MIRELSSRNAVIVWRGTTPLERPTGHNSSTSMLRAHRLHRVGDSASRAFRTAHRNRLRCCRVIVAS